MWLKFYNGSKGDFLESIYAAIERKDFGFMVNAKNSNAYMIFNINDGLDGTIYVSPIYNEVMGLEIVDGNEKWSPTGLVQVCGPTSFYKINHKNYNEIISKIENKMGVTIEEYSNGHLKHYETVR